MNPKIQEITIDGTVYVPKGSQPEMASRDGLPYVCVRTYSAGVHCGYLKSRDGKEVELVDSIRIWAWHGAASLSQLALEGVSRPKECKFGVPLPSITLTEAIEVIPMTDKARESIQGVPSWRV